MDGWPIRSLKRMKTLVPYTLFLGSILLIPSCAPLTDSGMKHRIAENVKSTDIYKCSAYGTEKGKPTVGLVVTNDWKHFPMLFNKEGNELIPLKQTVYSEHDNRGWGEAIKYTIEINTQDNKVLPLERYYITVSWSRKTFHAHRIISYSAPAPFKSRQGYCLRDFNPKLKK